MNIQNEFHTVRGYQLLDHNSKLLTPAMEDYLEMIYRNSLREGYMRVNTLSELLNVQAPSTTKMIQKLSSLGMVDYKKYGIIYLTDMGREFGKLLLKRHEIIEKLLDNLGVSENLLLETELIEHNISSSTLRKFEMLNLFFHKNSGLLNELRNFILQNEV